MSNTAELIEVWDGILGGIQRPIILMGAGARKASSEIVAFAEKYQIPILTTWNAIDLIARDNPLFIGRPGIVATRAANFAVQGCDLLLSVGARLDVSTIAFEYEKFAPNAIRVMVDIDKNETMKIPNLDLFINMDSLKFIQELNEHEFVPRRDWLKKCQDWKSEYGSEGKTTTFQLCETLSNALTSDDVIVFDNAGSAGGSIFPAFFKQKKGQRVIMSSCGLGSMGGGIPSAIGVALASKKRIILIEGDGSFCQCMQELEVIKRLNLNITMFIIENGGYASIRSSEMRAFGRVGEGLSFPIINRIASAFDICYSHYNPLSINYYLKQTDPMVVVVHAPGDEFPIPRVMFDGKGSLENMYPYGDIK
jgi:acetolactate synthase-1/2/3 large subunit